MTVKKSYYDILVYLIKNTAMKARPVDGNNNDIWLCWIPEIQRMARMDNYPTTRKFLNAPMIDYYRKHPEEFVEEILGVKLEPYQKEMLKGLYRNG